MRKIKCTERLRNVPKISRLVRTTPQDFDQGTTPELNFNRSNGLKKSHYKTTVSIAGGIVIIHTLGYEKTILELLLKFVLAHPFVKCLFLHVIKCNNTEYSQH